MSREYEAASPLQLSSPGSTGRSSTPRPIGLNSGASGILDHPHARVMTPCVCHHESRTILIVVLAKARTHYPKSQSLRDAGAAIPFTIKCGGYGSWLSPGRRLGRSHAHVARMRRYDSQAAQQTQCRPCLVRNCAREQGPITTNVDCCAALGPRSRSQSNAVVMGPGFRQDDDWGDRTLMSRERECMIHKSRNKPSIVPAEAGTHNHKCRLLRGAGTTSSDYNIRCGVWVPASAGTTAVFVVSVRARRLRKNPPTLTPDGSPSPPRRGRRRGRRAARP